MKVRGIVHLKSAVYFSLMRIVKVKKDHLQRASIRGDPRKSFTQSHSSHNHWSNSFQSCSTDGECKPQSRIKEYRWEHVWHQGGKTRQRKKYTDARSQVLHFNSGDLVWVTKAWKWEHTLTQPRAIVQKNGEDFYLLDDDDVHPPAFLWTLTGWWRGVSVTFIPKNIYLSSVGSIKSFRAILFQMPLI